MSFQDWLLKPRCWNLSWLQPAQSLTLQQCQSSGEQSNKDQGQVAVGGRRQHKALLLLSAQVSKTVTKHVAKYRSVMFNVYKVYRSKDRISSYFQSG